MLRYKTLRWFTCCALISFFFWQCYEHRVVELNIQTPHGDAFSIRMPWKDKQQLTHLFYKMMIREDGGYTLFGCKPMHMNGYIKPFSWARDWNIFFLSLCPSNLRTYWSWQTWQKYAYLLTNSQFLLWTEENPTWPEPHDAVSILLVHRGKFNEAIRTHRQDFVAVLHRNEVDSEILLQESRSKPLLKTVLQGHNGLIGTLFGYGRSNAWLFEKRKNGESVSLSPVWDQELYKFMWDHRNSEDLSLTLDYPSFYCDPNSSETQQLKDEFLKVRAKILEYYKGKEFLEATLGLMLDRV